MLSGLKANYRKFQALKRIFKQIPKISKLVDIYGLDFETYPDADINWPMTKLFYQAFSQEGMSERYQALVKNLDLQSRNDVSDIINGVLQVGHGYKKASVLMKKGVEAMASLKEHFYDRIVRLSDDLYVWQNYYLPANHFDPACLYYRSGLDFLVHPKRFSEMNIIDAGGFVGDSILLMAPYTKARVYCFEPVPVHVELIRRTIELNGISNATVEQAALGDFCGRIEISMNGEVDGGAHSTNLSTASDCSISSNELEDKKLIKQTTLDAYVEEKKLTDVGLIKVDIEGAEMQALLGAEKTIRKFRPALLISIYHKPDDFFEIKPMIEGWGLGYDIKIRRCPGYLYADTMLIAEAAI